MLTAKMEIDEVMREVMDIFKSPQGDVAEPEKMVIDERE